MILIIGCQYISALTSKEAKQIALYKTDLPEQLENPFIELRVTRCWNVDREKIEKYIKEKIVLDIYEINNLGLSWWSCPECDNEDFNIIDDYTYKCNNCKNEFEIPYI